MHNTVGYPDAQLPGIAIDSAGVTTRGERIRKARNLRRPKMSQLDLANATGVGMRTIGRIEAGEAENSPSLDVLERFFGIVDDQPSSHEGSASADPGGLRATFGDLADAATDNPRIKDATFMELLAEVAVRYAASERVAGRSPALPRHDVEWHTEDAPSTARERSQREAGKDEAL